MFLRRTSVIPIPVYLNTLGAESSKAKTFFPVKFPGTNSITIDLVTKSPFTVDTRWCKRTQKSSERSNAQIIFISKLLIVDVL